MAPEVAEKYMGLYEFGRLTGTTGFLALVVGLGSAGWIHSKLLGALSTLAALAVVIYVFAFASELIRIAGS